MKDVRLVSIILSREHMERLKKRQKVVFRVGPVVVEIQFLGAAPEDEIVDDNLAPQLEFWKSSYGGPDVQEYEYGDVVRLVWLPGRIRKTKDINGVKLYYNGLGSLMGIDIPKKANQS